MPSKAPKQKSRVSNDNQDDSSRGDAIVHGGNKVHGDDLEGVIPNTPMRVNRPTRDDGDNDDKGAPK